VQEVTSHAALMGFVASGLGVAVTASSNQSLRRVGVVFVPLSGLEASLAIHWSGANLSAAASEFLRIAKDRGKKQAWSRALKAAQAAAMAGGGRTGHPGRRKPPRVATARTEDV
jgi:hypothetical protein